MSRALRQMWRRIVVRDEIHTLEDARSEPPPLSDIPWPRAVRVKEAW
jgi:hypothetical protein